MDYSERKKELMKFLSSKFTFGHGVEMSKRELRDRVSRGLGFSVSDKMLKTVLHRFGVSDCRIQVNGVRESYWSGVEFSIGTEGSIYWDFCDSNRGTLGWAGACLDEICRTAVTREHVKAGFREISRNMPSGVKTKFEIDDDLEPDEMVIGFRIQQDNRYVLLYANKKSNKIN